jgi:SSS family solute:Na+ symporter
MSGIGALDTTVIVVYFAAIVGFGALLGRFTRSTRDFFLAGQRFPAWLVAFSCVATVVGSYSFVKYSAAGFRYGLASSQTYFNDWIWMPLFLFGWLPILYYSRILSVPEYFHKRFDRATGVAATVVLLLYLVGYIGINLFTIGRALESLFGIDLFLMALVVTALCMVYEWTGGQTSVIFTDLFQGGLLLVAGLAIAVLGLSYLGGLDTFVERLGPANLEPLARFNDSARFNFAGIFWQDGMAGGVAFYFMNQGMLMRFMSARSVGEGRRAALVVLLVLMPLAAIAVSGAGWFGLAATRHGDLFETTPADEIFVAATDLLAMPGLYGVIMAALLAALMSTADTLINASSALLVNDVYRPYLRPGRSETHYLRAARWTSLLAAGAGLALVPLYASFGTIYEAHGAFTAAITPPMAVALLLAFVWPRFTPRAALWTLVGGTALMFVSIAFPAIVTPFAHGIPPDGGYKYIRAFFGVVVSTGIALAVTPFTRPRDASALEGLTVWSLARVRRRFLGGDPAAGGRSRLRAVVGPSAPATVGATEAAVPEPAVAIDRRAMEALGVREGGLLFVNDARWWLGGLRSTRIRALAAPADDPAAADVLEPLTLSLPEETLRANGWREGRRLTVQVVD